MLVVRGFVVFVFVVSTVFRVWCTKVAKVSPLSRYLNCYILVIILEKCFALNISDSTFKSGAFLCHTNKSLFIYCNAGE